MPVGRVIRDEIEKHADPPPFGLCNETVDVGKRPQIRMDSEVVRDVVAPVDVRRGVNRVEPDPVDPEPLEVVEPGDDPGEVADPVAVGVGERARVDLVEDAAAPPGVSRTHVSQPAAAVQRSSCR